MGILPFLILVTPKQHAMFLLIITKKAILLMIWNWLLPSYTISLATKNTSMKQ
jgi:hypothetical protein